VEVWMRIVVETLPGDHQRYPTAGDYWRDADGTIQVRVSEMGNEQYELLVALHEIIEFMLCDARGISEADITSFDMRHLHLDEPGEHPDAPYRKEHAFAEAVERLLAHEFGITWDEYSAGVEATF
jgi:hypothetical protein